MRKMIDYLANLFTPKSIKEEYVEGAEQEQFARVNRQATVRGYEPNEFVQYLDTHGVERILITSMKIPDPWRLTWMTNVDAREVAEAARSCPGRVYGLFGCNPRSALAGVHEFEHFVKHEGFRGLHIHPHGFGLPPNHAYYFPWYAKAVELDVPVVISMGTTLALLGIEVARPIYLDDVALYFPDLKLVCGHTGYPWIEEAIAVVWKHDNMYLGTSAHAPRYWKPELVQFANSRRGRNKVMFGSDWPLIQHGEALKQIEDLHLREETLDSLLHDNAARVFGFDG
jgi:predicted TIM-barrel fold metal-dependent hydrolase